MNGQVLDHKSALHRYSVVILSVVAAIILSSAVAPYVHPDFVQGFFYLATCVSAWYGGPAPAFTAAALGLPAANWIAGFPGEVEIIVFSGISIAFAYLSHTSAKSVIEAKRRQAGLEQEILNREHSEATLRRSEEMLKEAGKSKDEFLAQLSHELRTPLTPVLAAAQLIERSPEASVRIRNLVSTIIRNVALEARLIDDLLDITRIAHGKVRLRRSVVNLHALINNCVEMCRSQIDEKKHNLALELNAESPVIRADPARVSQIVWNLLSNAVKFTPPGGSIVLRTANSSSGRIAVSVLDTGNGIEAEAMNGIFNAFDQGTSTEGFKQGGLGLGLAISRSLAELHSGSLRARSDGRGKGAEFILELPVVPVGEMMVDIDSRTAARIKGGLEILLVEDHPDTANLMKTALEMEGHRAEVAHDVRTALDAGRKKHFDLLVSDIGLPDGSGLEIIRALSPSNNMKGIALTGFGMEEDVKMCLAAGFSAHLTKPVDLNALQETIKKILA